MHRSLRRTLGCLVVSTAVFCTLPAGAEDTISNEVVIDGTAEAVWRALTTEQGLESWIVPHASVDLRAGGFLRTNHIRDGKIGDENTVTNRILTVNPKKRLSIKLAEAPKSIPLAASLVGTWYEISLNALPKNQTRVRCVGHGFPSGPMGYTGRMIAGQGNAWALQQLQKHFVILKSSRPK